MRDDIAIDPPARGEDGALNAEPAVDVGNARAGEHVDAQFLRGRARRIVGRCAHVGDDDLDTRPRKVETRVIGARIVGDDERPPVRARSRSG